VPGTSGITGVIEGTMAPAATAGMLLCARGGVSTFETTERLSKEGMSLAMRPASELAGKFPGPH
jgi:hypothetical protein